MGMILSGGRARRGVRPCSRAPGREDVRENHLQEEFGDRAEPVRGPLISAFVLDIAEQALPQEGVVCLS